MIIRGAPDRASATTLRRIATGFRVCAMLDGNMTFRPLIATITLFIITLTACGGSDSSTTTTGLTTSTTETLSSSTSQAPATTSAAITTLTTADVPSEGVAVSFQTSDGVMLEGRRFGAGPDLVVLAHMLPASMESWFDFAAVLADQGYSAIAFNFRGYGNSEGGGFSVSTDVTAAFDYAVDSGAARVFGIGASMGGTGVLTATADREFAGAASLSAPAVFEGSDAIGGVAVSTAPLLLIAAEDDAPYPADAETIRSVRPDAEVLILAGSRHGTNLFIDHGEELEAVLLEFLAGQN